MDTKKSNKFKCENICYVSPVTCHLSQMPTATATDPPLQTPPLCTVGWFTRMSGLFGNQPIYPKYYLITPLLSNKRGFLSFAILVTRSLTRSPRNSGSQTKSKNSNKQRSHYSMKKKKKKCWLTARTTPPAARSPLHSGSNILKSLLCTL